MSIDAHFGDLHEIVRQELLKAKNRLRIAVAWISFERYAPILLELAARGVDIFVLCSDCRSNRRQSAWRSRLELAGIQCVLFKMPSGRNHMHHKFAVVDDCTVLNGSFNWSENAPKNFENLLIIRDEPNVARQFLTEVAKIQALDTDAVRAIHALERCHVSKCPGRLVNLLVFDPIPAEMTFEIWGDLIQVCSVCAEERYQTIRSGIQDTSLFAHLTAHELVDSDTPAASQIARFDLRLDQYLTGYTINNIVLHAIGLVRERDAVGDPGMHTKIVWKNKFVDRFVRDEYETSFGVNYSSQG